MTRDWLGPLGCLKACLLVSQNITGEIRHIHGYLKNRNKHLRLVDLEMLCFIAWRDSVKQLKRNEDFSSICGAFPSICGVSL